MKLVYAFGGAGLSFLLLAAMIVPLERTFPAKKGQKILRPGWLTDLLFFIGQYLFWGGVMLAALDASDRWIASVVPPSFRAMVAAQPWWLQALEVVVLSDFMIYWGHRLQHRVGFLWRFHAVHHSTEHMDWLAGHRDHPVDTLYTMTLINLPAAVFGFPLETLAALTAFRGIWSIYVHSNVRLPIPFLRWFIGAPELHHWHHARARESGNYCDVSPLMDLIFGTYRCPDHEPAEYGVSEQAPRGYIGQLLWPFRRKS